jgi:hypothetical protein
MILNLTLSSKEPIVTDEMLKDCKSIRKLSLSKDVVKLPVGAFHNAIHLTKIYFEPGSKLVKIPEACFKGCQNLTRINNLPSELVSIDDFAFCGCVSLNEIWLPSSVMFVAETAFDGWCEEQTIYCDKPFGLSGSCEAKIISANLENSQDHSQIDSRGKKHFIVEVKCGHVGRDHYVPIKFPVIAENAKEAARKARTFPRVKKHHKDAILSVEKVESLIYFEQIKVNKDDPYLLFRSKHEQNILDSIIKDRKHKEPRYIKLVDKRKPIKYKKEGKSKRYYEVLEKLE